MATSSRIIETTMKIEQSQLEAAIQAWLRDSLAPLLREGGVQVDPTAARFIQELDSLSRTDPSGDIYAPDQFTLSVHPEAAAGLGGTIPDLHSALSRDFENLLSQHGFTLNRRLHISLATDPTLDPGEVQVIAWHSGDPLKVTRELDPARVEEIGTAPDGAFLMVAGRRHMSLSTPEVRVGRLGENDLVLDDPHISRRHALIRLENSRYVIYDLDSTAGVSVNGVRVGSHTLRPGDVIRLADIEIIYGEEPGRPPDESPQYEPPEQPEAPEHEVTPLDLRGFDFPTRDRDEPPTEDEGDTEAFE